MRLLKEHRKQYGPSLYDVPNLILKLINLSLLGFIIEGDKFLTFPVDDEVSISLFSGAADSLKEKGLETGVASACAKRQRCVCVWRIEIEARAIEESQKGLTRLTCQVGGVKRVFSLVHRALVDPFLVSTLRRSSS